MSIDKEIAQFWKDKSRDWEELANAAVKVNEELRTMIKTLDEKCTALKESKTNDTFCHTCQSEFIKEINELRDAIDELQTEKAVLKQQNDNLQNAINKLSEIIWGNIK